MNGVRGDIQSVGEFIRMYLTRSNRWMSPLFIAGESYGTFRAAGLAGALVEDGIAVNGVTLISTILNYGTGRGSFDQQYSLRRIDLPTFTADAGITMARSGYCSAILEGHAERSRRLGDSHHALEALNKETPSATTNVRLWSINWHATPACRRLTSIISNLRLDVGHFSRELLRDKKLTIGRYDGRLTGPSGLNAGEVSEFDPSGTLTRPPFQAAFMQYITNELEYKSDMTYDVQGGILPWDWGAENNYVDTTAALRDAFTKNPYLKVMVCAGYFDLATPYFAAEYTLNHMGVHPETQKNITCQFYEAGHMMYIDKPPRQAEKGHLRLHPLCPAAAVSISASAH